MKRFGVSRITSGPLSLPPIGNLLSRLIYTERKKLFRVRIKCEEFSRGDHEETTV